MQFKNIFKRIRILLTNRFCYTLFLNILTNTILILPCKTTETCIISHFNNGQVELWLTFLPSVLSNTSQRDVQTKVDLNFTFILKNGSDPAAKHGVVLIIYYFEYFQQETMDKIHKVCESMPLTTKIL